MFISVVLMFAVFMLSLGGFGALVITVQFLNRFGWFSRRARETWQGILAIAICAYAIPRFAAHLPPERWGPAVAVGVLVGIILLATGKSRWGRPTSS